MNVRFCSVALLFVGLSVSAIATSAAAAPPKQFLVAPGEPYGLPKFGFSSSTISGFGERIEFVRPGGRAFRLGLEPGDVILSLNGYKLTYSGSWNDALSRALYDGNLVRLKIRDVRTGNVYFRETYVDYDNGQVQNHFKTTNTFDSKFHDDLHHDDVHHDGPSVKTIKDIKKLVE
jgi:predicted metalloprotease with PDZ domain